MPGDEGPGTSNECFRNVARALRPGGRFVLECFVPDPARFRDANRAVRVTPGSSSDRFRLDASIHFPDEQRVKTDVPVVRDGRLEVLPVTVRCIWPADWT